MAINSAIILSNDRETTSATEQSCRELELELVTKNDFPALLLELQENDYSAVFCDCSEGLDKCLQWVKVIKKIRPKVPLIVISNEADKQAGGQLYQEGIFHLCEKPIDKQYLKKILLAI